MEKTVEASFNKALKAYGIAEEFVLTHRVKGDTVIIVTQGGEKVSWRPGDKVEKLEPIRVDGVIRKKMKTVTGAKKGGK